MTDRPARRRFSKRALQAMAWVTGGLAFAAPLGALAASPKVAGAERAEQAPQLIVVRTITRRVVVHAAPGTAPIRYVYVDGSSSGAPASTGSTTAPSAATSTGGS